MIKDKTYKVFVLGEKEENSHPKALSSYGSCDVYYFPQEKHSVMELMNYAPDIIFDKTHNDLVECYKM